MKRLVLRLVRSAVFFACAAVIPVTAAAADRFEGMDSSPLPAISSEPAGDAQKLEQKPEVYLELIAGMQGRGLYYASLAHLDAFEARWPGRADAMLLRAHALRETGQTGAAKLLYEKLRDGPFAARAYHGLGLIAARDGNLVGASAALRRAAELAPTDAAILNDQGYALLMLGKVEDARLALFKAAELDDGNKRIGANLALLLTVTGKREEAQELMQHYDLAPRVREEIVARAAAVTLGGKPGKEATQ